MDENRIPAYLNLIQQLLNCSIGEEEAILNANSQLIDLNLVQMMQQVADELAEQGDQNNADFFRSLAEQLTEALEFLMNRDFLLDILIEIVKANDDNNRQQELVYARLSSNLDKLNENLAISLRRLGTDDLPNVSPEDRRDFVAGILNFSNLIQKFPLGNKAANLEIAIAGYEVVATVLTRDAFPWEWGTLQNSLGAAYSDRICGNRAENLENALRCYKAALQVRTRQNYLADWVMTQNNLGTAYLERFLGNRAKNLERAIRHFKAALRVCTQTDSPEQWGMLQNNLGDAYRQRIRGDRAENLEKAIEAHEAALEVHNENKLFREWARSKYNLGNAYSERIRGDRADNLEKAIEAYEEALTVRTDKEFPREWAMTQDSLGEAYRTRIHGDRVDNLKKAIKAYKKALTVRTREDLPRDWAKTQNNLGNAYSELPGERCTDLAIKAYQAVLDVYTREEFPYQWATIQNNLGGGYLNQGRISTAIECLKLALEVYTPTAFPVECFKIGRNLGYTASWTQQWTDAIKGYSNAIEAVETSREWAISDARKAEILSTAIDVYTGIVQVYINNEQPDKAIEYVERSKARNLVELLANKDLYPKPNFYTDLKIYETDCHKLEELRRQIPAKQRELQILISSDESSDERFRNQEKLRQIELNNLKQDQERLSAELNRLLATINQIDSNFTFTQKVQPIPLSDIQSLTDENTAIVEWYITGSQILTFIVTCHYPQPILVASEEMTALENWDNEYRDSYQNQKNKWINNLASRLKKLAEILHIDEILSRIDQCFSESGAKCSRLILIPHRYLHLFPLHALPLADGKLLCKRFPQGVGYAPSCQLLKQAKDQEQNRPNFTHLFAIQNPTRQPPKPLLGSQLEIDNIRQYFDLDQSVILKEAEATETNLYERMEQMSSSHCIHFSCHGKFYPESPLKSALLLADPEGKVGEEANLTLGEIFEKLYLNQCRLVTFSACESGMTDPNSISDEYIGLPSGFLYAGSLSVVSTLWSVDPIATTLLMVKFYHNLKRLPSIKTGDVAIALNKAQKWLRSLTNKKLAIINKKESRFQLQLKQAFENQEDDLDSFNLLLNQAVNTKKPERQPYPFANPYYWSAFVAIGL